MKIFTVSQMRELDQYTIAHEPIASIALMERASGKFAEAFAEEISSMQRIVVFAGPGNNGGDALAVARILMHKGYKMIVYLLNIHNKLSEDCEINRFRLLSVIRNNYFELSDDLSPVNIKQDDIVIDGLFGSGLNKPLNGIAAELVHLINNSGTKVYSIDMPSGLFGETNENNIFGNIIKATKTFTFQSLKLAFLLPDNEIYVGQWKVLDIGLHDKTIMQTPTYYHYLEKADISKLLKSREKFAYKNNFGHALIVAGSKGKMGAAVLSTKATLRSGAGLVTTHIPSRGEIVMHTAFPEAMLGIDEHEDMITGVSSIEGFSAIGIGPGIGTEESTRKVLGNIFINAKKPLVVDADALNLIAGDKKLMKILPPCSILTPHVGELQRLTKKSNSSYDTLELARDLAATTLCIVVLKGAYSAVCLPDKKVYFNSTGNAGMATAGSGDVLTGIITGLLAQSYSPENAAKIGVYMHGLAGDIAVKERSEESLIAQDIIDYLGKAFVNIIS